jgi:hypothetical protein
VSAIVPYARGVVRRAQTGRTVAQFASGGVAADVRIERVDARNRRCWYAIKLASNDCDLTGRLVGVRRGGGVDELGSVEVMPRSVGSGSFAVTTPRTGAYQAMYLEVWSGEMLLRVEAPQPPAPRGSGALRAGGLLVALGIVATCAGAMPLAFAHDAKRSQLAHAPAAVRHAVVPHGRAQPAPARVLSFAARRDDAPGGETVLASYLATGERGTVALLDAQGLAITSGAFTRVGTLRLRVPAAYRALPLTARITVHRGTTKAVSDVVLPANAQPAPRPSPSPDAAAAGAPPDAAAAAAPDAVAAAPAPNAAAAAPAPNALRADAQTAVSASASGLIAVEGRVIAGRPLRLRLAPQASPMRVALEDETGAVIVETSIAPGATRAALVLPPSASSATYLLALHYSRDGGEETVIRTIAAAAR